MADVAKPQSEDARAVPLRWWQRSAILVPLSVAVLGAVAPLTTATHQFISGSYELSMKRVELQHSIHHKYLELALQRHEGMEDERRMPVLRFLAEQEDPILKRWAKQEMTLVDESLDKLREERDEAKKLASEKERLVLEKEHLLKEKARLHEQVKQQNAALRAELAKALAVREELRGRLLATTQAKKKKALRAEIEEGERHVSEMGALIAASSDPSDARELDFEEDGSAALASNSPEPVDLLTAAPPPEDDGPPRVAFKQKPAKRRPKPKPRGEPDAASGGSDGINCEPGTILRVKGALDEETCEDLLMDEDGDVTFAPGTYVHSWRRDDVICMCRHAEP
jgi:hypothetical protein